MSRVASLSPPQRRTPPATVTNWHMWKHIFPLLLFYNPPTRWKLRSYKCSKCITNTSLKHCLDFHWFPCHVLIPADFISPKAGACTLSTVSTEPVHWPGTLKGTSAPCKGLEGSGRHWAGTACLLYKTNFNISRNLVIFLHHYVPVLSIVKIICSRGANLKDTVLQQVYSAKCLISHR